MLNRFFNRYYRQERISGLDGIRGFAFLIVFILHITYLDGSVINWIVGLPKVGVWLFFVLSAFLLTNYFINRPEKCKNTIEWLNYFIRRFLRVYPLFVIVVFIYYFFGLYVDSPEHLKNHLLLREGIHHFWTMPVEIKYYFTLPFVVFFIIFVLRKNIILTFLALIVTIAIHQYYFPYTMAQRESVSLIQYLPVFLTGSFTALIHHKLKNIVISKRVKSIMQIIAIIVGIGTFLSARGFVNRFIIEVPQDYLLNKYLYFGLTWCIFIICVIHGGGFVKKIFETRILRFFGTISYSGYLFHPLYIWIAASYLNGLNLLSVLFIVVFTLFSSMIAYLLIEEPLMRIRLIKKI